MKARLLKVLLCLAGIGWLGGMDVCFADGTSEQFLQAYQAFQAAEKLEGQSDPRRALLRYREAELLLAKIAAESPDWQPLVIGYRLKRTRESISRLETQTSGMPPLNEDLEGPLPSSPESGGAAEAKQTPLPLPPVTTSPGTRTPQRAQESRPARPLPRGGAEESPTLGNALRELAAARQEIQNMREENRRLNDRLEKSTANLKSALYEVDRTKVSVVELKSQLAQAKNALENLRNDRRANPEAIRAASEQETTFFLKKLAEAHADTEVLREENDALHAKLEHAASIIQSGDKIREELLGERQTLAQQKSQSLEEAAEARKNLEAAQSGLEAAQKELADARDGFGEKEKKLQSQLEESASRVEALTGELATLKSTHAETEALLTKARASADKKEEVARLAAENKKLEDKVADMEKRLQATGDSPALAGVRSELNTANDRLLESQAQLSSKDSRIEELAGELDKAAAELARLKLLPEPTTEEKNLLAENDLLRGIILRQIKQQNRRDEALRGLEGELARLKVQSQDLNVQLAILGSPVLELNPEERMLFKEPVSLLHDTAADKLDVAMAVVKPTEQEATENLQPQPPASAPQGAEDLTPEAREMVRQAQEAFNRKDYAEAEKIYQKIAGMLPENYFVLSNLGAVQIESGKPSAAEVALAKAVGLSPEDSFAQTHLGIAFSRQGRFDDAEVALRKAVDLNPSDAVAHNYLGVCLAQKGDRDAAEETFKKAISLDANYANAHFNLAVLYATAKPPALELAKHHYQLATELGAAPDSSIEQIIQ